MMNKNKLGGRVWVSLILFGLLGQLAWVIENMYFNVFLYKTVTYDPGATAWMVAASALTATATTLLMGALSDKVARRKPFIVWGSVVWGLVIMSFALIRKETTARLFPGANAVALTAAIVVLMDCVMTFFGSTANDACLNAWITDVTVPETRGRTEGVLMALSLVATMIVFGGLDGLTQSGNWTLFFVLIGGLVCAGGLAGLFLTQDHPGLRPAQNSFAKNVIYGFRPSVIKEHKGLYVIFCAMAISFTAQQVFMPYLLVYFEYYLGVKDYALPLALLLVLAAAASVLGGRLVDRIGKRRFLLPCWAIGVAGFVAMWLHGLFLRGKGTLTIVTIVAAGAVMMGGYLLMGIVLGASARDAMPERSRGHFAGVRMIFVVLIPMVAGPFIGSAIIKNGASHLDEFGQTQYIPHAGIFAGAAVVALLLLLPIGWLLKNKMQPAE